LFLHITAKNFFSQSDKIFSLQNFKNVASKKFADFQKTLVYSLNLFEYSIVVKRHHHQADSKSVNQNSFVNSSCSFLDLQEIQRSLDLSTSHSFS